MQGRGSWLQPSYSRNSPPPASSKSVPTLPLTCCGGQREPSHLDTLQFSPAAEGWGLTHKGSRLLSALSPLRCWNETLDVQTEICIVIWLHVTHAQGARGRQAPACPLSQVAQLTVSSGGVVSSVVHTSGSPRAWHTRHPRPAAKP